MNELSKNIHRLKERTDFFHFDQFIIQKMLDGEKISSGQILPEVRKRAYLKCLAAMGKERFVAIQTLQKWFGIHGCTLPSRENIFRLGFALHMSVDEVREYLVHGLCEQDFQMNDYREVILIYGIGQQITYEETLTMISDYEKMLSEDITLIQHNQTNDMLQEYQLNCHLPPKEFLQWMFERCEYFKGYSKTVLDYFKLYKEEILTYVKEDACKMLDDLLEQTNYNQWAKKKRVSSKKKRKSVKQYIQMEKGKGGAGISESMEKNLLEMLQIANLSVKSNSELLLELYTSINKKVRNYKTNNRKDKTKKRFPLEINLMSDKYLSNLINISTHKERQLLLTITEHQLMRCQDVALCPNHILDCISRFGYEKKKRPTVEEAKCWVAKRRKEQGRRCQLLHRRDLLPLILCVSQKRYLKENNTQTDVDGEEARKKFVLLANATLSACHMELLQPERFELDAVLMQCFQEDELYCLSDVLEELVR